MKVGPCFYKAIKAKQIAFERVISPPLVHSLGTDQEPLNRVETVDRTRGNPCQMPVVSLQLTPLALAHKHSQELFNAISISRFHC